jgi:mono/diheme cytochrome c family protein
MEAIMRLKYFTLGSAILIVFAVWQVASSQVAPRPEPRPAAPGQEIGPAAPADLLKHGAYLVNSVAMCGDCHTPRDNKGMPDRTRPLAGMTLPIQPKAETNTWADQSPNISATGLAGKLTEEQAVKFLMTGIDPSGKTARPPMPQFRLNATDARAVYVYLNSVPGSSGIGQSKAVERK